MGFRPCERSGPSHVLRCFCLSSPSRGWSGPYPPPSVLLMRYETLVALRYLRSRRSFGFVTLISVISIAGITTGVAALIIVLSVFNGFGSLVTSILVSFDPH